MAIYFQIETEIAVSENLPWADMHVDRKSGIEIARNSVNKMGMRLLEKTMLGNGRAFYT